MISPIRVSPAVSGSHAIWLYVDMAASSSRLCRPSHRRTRWPVPRHAGGRRSWFAVRAPGRGLSDWPGGAGDRLPPGQGRVSEIHEIPWVLREAQGGGAHRVREFGTGDTPG